MTDLDEPTRQRDFPDDWDVVRGAFDGSAAPDPGGAAPGPGPHSAPPMLSVMAASWADAVAVLVVCAATLLGLDALGHRPSLGALPWAGALGALWWVVAAAALVTVRQATPGMLLAGLSFSRRVSAGRVGLVVAVAAVCALLLGAPGLLGARLSPLAAAAAAPLRQLPVA
ncbi:MAG: hypothetical protein MUC56_03985 [Thermoanaerobaculales bacterium]|nr:hypothetical protein [Thermoanaerobaculales bacterium]